MQFHTNVRRLKTSVPGQPDIENRVIVYALVSTHYWRVTDRQTDILVIVNFLIIAPYKYSYINTLTYLLTYLLIAESRSA